jgi:hypothetical protein
MIWTIVFYLYLSLFVILIVHEMDSVHWKEWELFGMKGGVEGFLLVHFPLLALLTYGLVLVYEKSQAGLIYALSMGVAGIGGFGIHQYFIQTGHPEFTTPLSRTILWLMLSGGMALSGSALWQLFA